MKKGNEINKKKKIYGKKEKVKKYMEKEKCTE